MKIYNYRLYNILEGKGISDKVKELSDIVIGTIFKNSFTDFILNTGLNKMETLDIIIKHDKEDYHSSVYSKTNSLYDLKITFDIPIKPNPYYLHEIIVHEFTHLWEFYNIKIKNLELPMYSKINKALKLTMKSDDFNILSEFRYLIYLTLDNELNARVSQVYQHLKATKIINKNLLLNSIKNSSSWKKMETIEKFNPNDYFTSLIYSIGIDLSLILINDLNKELLDNGFNKSFIKNLNNECELKSYLKSWSRIFKYKMKKHREKLLRIIEII